MPARSSRSVAAQAAGASPGRNCSPHGPARGQRPPHSPPTGPQAGISMMTMKLSESDDLVERLAEEMSQRWRRGERPVVEDFLALFPKLWGQPEAATELIYEEICLRQEHGQETATTDLFRRFPQWQQQLQAILDFHQLIDPGPVVPNFPQPRETLGEFHLL